MLEDKFEKIKKVIGTIKFPLITVIVSEQKLYFVEKNGMMKIYPVSTSVNGMGNVDGSLKTPAGVHKICEKYGHNAPIGRIFRDRIDTGEDWPIDMPGENLILTRILRLEGLEDGINRGHGIDSYERYIYIHGSGNEQHIGTPWSHGCVCMKNADVVDLFELAEEGTIVLID
jgi:lipoprotein-anchoring transpeptidase ErfK/SrfK